LNGNMKLLAWDTSQKAGALVALEWDLNGKYRLVSEWAINVDSTHSEQLLWGIHQLLQSIRWKLEDIDVFGVGIGPGSFTGLRIGITTARTLANALNKPLIGVSSLAALARPAALWLSQQNTLRKSRTILIAATDACKGELFALWGNAKAITDCTVLSDGDYPGLWKRGAEEQVIAPDALMKAVKKKLAEGTQKDDVTWFVVGEGRNRYPEAWKLLPEEAEIVSPVPFSDQIQGRYLGLLVWEAFQAGLVRKPLEVHPRYVRASDAELKLKAGLLPKGPTRS
jgi:tRNA threonylcarbamoyl adenosine modification protein YeaZ